MQNPFKNQTPTTRKKRRIRSSYDDSQTTRIRVVSGFFRFRYIKIAKKVQDILYLKITSCTAHEMLKRYRKYRITRKTGVC